MSERPQPTEDTGAFYFPPPGQGLANQDLRHPSQRTSIVRIEAQSQVETVPRHCQVSTMDLQQTPQAQDRIVVRLLMLGGFQPVCRKCWINLQRLSQFCPSLAWSSLLLGHHNPPQRFGKGCRALDNRGDDGRRLSSKSGDSVDA